ncbi:porimin isoform X2 [Hyperolius riggenbachi]
MLLAAGLRGWRLSALLLLATLCTSLAGDSTPVPPVTSKAVTTAKPKPTEAPVVAPTSTVHITSSTAPATTNSTDTNTTHTAPPPTTAKATTKAPIPASTTTTTATTTAAAKPTGKSTTAASTTSSAVTSSISSAIQKQSGFDLGSFIGGIVLTVGILAVLYFGCRFYNSRNGVRYRTMNMEKLKRSDLMACHQ